MIVAHDIQQDQENRQIEASSTEEIQLDREENIYGAGKFDAVIGAEPDPVLTANES